MNGEGERDGETYVGEVYGELPGTLEEIWYERYGEDAGHYRHPFETPSRILAMEDGRLLIEPKEEDTMEGLWLDNRPKHHRRHNRGGHHRHHRHHNPYLALLNRHRHHRHNPPLREYFSASFAKTALSGGAGVAATYLAFRTLFGLSAVSAYATGSDYTSIGVRIVGRIGAMIGVDMLLGGLVPDRSAFVSGSAAYVGAAGLLELLGYQVTIGAPAGQPLTAVLPAAISPGGSGAGVGAFLQPRRALRGATMGAFVRPSGMSGLDMGAHRLMSNRLVP